MGRCSWIRFLRVRHQVMIFIIAFIFSLSLILLKTLIVKGYDTQSIAKSINTRITKITNPVLIFTCLGALAVTKHQSYIWSSLKQARLFNPTIDIVVILDKSELETAVQNRFHALNVTTMIYEDLISKSVFVKSFQRHFFQTDSAVPDGNHEFIRLTLERLFLIHAYLMVKKRNHVFHMENDNMLYINLEELSKRMNECNIRFAAPRASKDLAVVSFAYFRNLKSLEHFLRWCIDVLRTGPVGATKFMNTRYINDMTLTSRYLNLYASSLQRSIQSGIHELPAQFIANESDCCLCFFDHQFILFDACVLGQYFGGTYAYPNRSYWESNRLIDPRGIPLTWIQTEQQIKVPYINDRRIMNIHVHSKHLDRFSSVGNQQTKGFIF